MWDDELTKLKDKIESEAKRCSIEVRLLGRLLKFTPLGVFTKVLLELEQSNSNKSLLIYKHRNRQLTSEHKGKAVSIKWIIAFLNYHSSEAKDLIKKHEEVDAKNANKPEKDPEVSKHVIRNPAATIPLQTFGYSANKEICRVCNGDGGAAGQCYKCGGSGWA